MGGRNGRHEKRLIRGLPNTAVFDKRRKYYQTRRDGDVKGIIPEAVDSFMATLCAAGWDLEAAGKRRKG